MLSVFKRSSGESAWQTWTHCEIASWGNPSPSCEIHVDSYGRLDFTCRDVRSQFQTRLRWIRVTNLNLLWNLHGESVSEFAEHGFILKLLDLACSDIWSIWTSKQVTFKASNSGSMWKTWTWCKTCRGKSSTHMRNSHSCGFLLKILYFTCKHSPNLL